MPTADVNLNELKAKAARMLAKMRASEHEFIPAQRSSASADVQDRAAHERQRSALLMLALTVQGETDIQAGRTIPQDRVFADIAHRLTRPEDG